MTTLTIQGHKFEVPEGFMSHIAVGYTLQEEGEAHTLRQTALENVRNNFAAKVRAAKNGGEEVSADALKTLQDQLNAYVAEYKFGERKAGGARGPRIVDPVEREMTKMAREDIATAFYTKHKEKLKGEALAEAAKKLLEAKHDDYARRARRAIADREKAGMDTLAAVGL